MMNAPNFDLEPRGQGGGQPAVLNGSRAIDGNKEMLFDFEAGAKPEGEFLEFRRSLFLVVGLAVRYRWLILTVCGVTLASGFYVNLASTPIYRATATIQLDRQAPRVVKIETAQDESGSDSDRFYDTQYGILKSQLMADQVASDLNLGAASDFVHPQPTSAWEKLRSLIFRSANKTTNQGSLQQEQAIAAKMVRGGLTVEAPTNTSLVRIEFDNPSPGWAQRIANGIADSYIKLNLQRRYGATAYARNFLKERLEELKLKLEESEKALVAYSEQKQLIMGGDKGSIAESDLVSLNGSLQKIVAERIDAQERWEQANGGNELTLPQVLKDQALQTLLQQRITLTSEYQNKLASFTPAYPDMLKLKSQIDAIDREIKAAVDIVKRSLKAHYDLTSQEETLLKSKIEEVKQGVLSTRDKEIQYNILKREADTNRTLYEGLLQQYKDIGIAGAVSTNNISVVDRAELPGAPYKPNLKNTLLKALVFGLVGSGLLIGLLEVLDDTFKSPEEIEEHLGLSVLGMIPHSDDVRANVSGSGQGHFAEAFRSLRTALQFSSEQGVPKTLLVTSTQPGEGKSTTALWLAANFAQLGMKVLLIDADLRNPSQHKGLKRSNDIGLSNYLAGQETPGRTFQTTDVEGLYLMPSGPLPPNPAELLAGSKMMSLLCMASEKVDTVIIDSPPIMGLADAPLLGSMALGTLLVIATPDARRSAVRAAVKRLHFARARMVGAVMNKCEFRSHYGYKYAYAYSALGYYSYSQKNASVELGHLPKA